MSGKPDHASSEQQLENAMSEQAHGEATDADAVDEGVPADEPSDPVSETARADENWDRYVRAAAELDNVRKRAARDVDNARKFALERFATELLEVRDSLEMGLAAETADVESLLEGSRTTLRQLAGTMERFGLVEVDPEGEPFDPNLHEAMTTQPSNDVEPGTVLAVFQKGYTLNGRLLRPARVVVAAE